MFHVQIHKLIQIGGGILFVWIIQSLVPALAQYTESKTYWTYKKDKDQRNYVIRPQKAAQDGVHLQDNKRTLGFKLLLTQDEYEALRRDKELFPIHVEWYRFNRAKPSIFTVVEVELDDLDIFEKNGMMYYRLTSKLEEVLEGTWIVKLSDRRGIPMEIGSAGEFEVIVH